MFLSTLRAYFQSVETDYFLEAIKYSWFDETQPKDSVFKASGSVSFSLRVGRPHNHYRRSRVLLLLSLTQS